MKANNLLLIAACAAVVALLVALGSAGGHVRDLERAFCVAQATHYRSESAFVVCFADDKQAAAARRELAESMVDRVNLLAPAMGGR